jgi:hypothetical protein
VAARLARPVQFSTDDVRTLPLALTWLALGFPGDAARTSGDPESRVLAAKLAHLLAQRGLLAAFVQVRGVRAEPTEA